MPWRFALLPAIVLILPGCGTFMNLSSPPPKLAPPSMACESECIPFGGVARSGLLGLVGVEYGPWYLITGGNQNDTAWSAAGVTCLGIGALVDTPLSLAGDVVTFPIALARSRCYPWATWWGDQGWEGPRPRVPADPVPETAPMQPQVPDGTIHPAIETPSASDR